MSDNAMHRRARLFGGSTAIALVIAVGAGFSAQAQTAAPSRAAANAQLDEVVVTARRREESLQNAPVAVAALTGQQLQRYAVTSINDLTRFIPGMVAGRQVAGSSASIFLRGVGSTSLSAGFDQSVSFNIDGVPMSRGREIALAQYDLKSVQVLKGPQALFFGKNATGGVVAVDSNNPTQDFEAQGTVGYGFHARETYGQGYISGPLTDKLGIRLAVLANKTEGWFKNTAIAQPDSAQAAAAPGRGAFIREPSNARRGGGQTLSGRLTVAYNPTDEFHINLKLSGTDLKDHGAGEFYERKCGAGRTTPLPTSGVADPQADCVINGRTDKGKLPREVAALMRYSYPDGRTYTHLVSGMGVLNMRYEAEQFDFTSITGYYGFAQQAGDDFGGAIRTIWNAQLSTMQQFSQEFRLQTKLDGQLNFTVGGFYSDTEFHYNIDSFINAVPYDPISNTYTGISRNAGFKGKTLSGFVEGIWTPMDTIEVSGGARYSHEEKDSFQQFLPANAALRTVYSQNGFLVDHYEQNNVSPQVTVRYKPNDQVTAYASYKEGFKAGGFNISGTILATAVIADVQRNGRFTAETTSGFEGGLRTALLDRSLHFNVTAYDYKYKDLQVQFYNPVTIAQVVSNAGELAVRGIEMDAAWRVPSVDGLSLYGAVAYNKATFHDFVATCYGGQTPAAGCNLLPNATGTAFNGQNFDGRTPPKAPRLGAKYGTTYDFEILGGLQASLTAEGNYSSKYYFTDTLRPDAIQPAFTRFDASASIGNPDAGWKLSLIGRNLTNKLVATSANDFTSTGGTGAGTAAGVPSDMNVVVERGREVYLELKMTF